MPEHKPGDIVRIIAPPSSTGHLGMIGSYIGQEARILHKHPDADLYQVELDVPRKPAAFGGALAPPTFIVRSDMIEPDITDRMMDAAFDVRDTPPETGKDICQIYRAMRAARFGR